MLRENSAALRIVHLETNRTLSKLDTDTAVRIARRALQVGKMEAILETGRQMTAASKLPDPNDPLQSWEVEIAVNGHTILALSEGVVAGIPNAREFGSKIETIVARIRDFIKQPSEVDAQPEESSEVVHVRQAIEHLRAGGFDDIALMVGSRYGL